MVVWYVLEFPLNKSDKFKSCVDKFKRVTCYLRVVMVTIWAIHICFRVVLECLDVKGYYLVDVMTQVIIIMGYSIDDFMVKLTILSHIQLCKSCQLSTLKSYFYLFWVILTYLDIVFESFRVTSDDFYFI